MLCAMYRNITPRLKNVLRFDRQIYKGIKPAIRIMAKTNNKVSKTYFASLRLSESDFYNKTIDELRTERIPAAIMAEIVLKFFKYSEFTEEIKIDKPELNNLLYEVKIMMDLFIKSDKSFKDLEELTNHLLG